MVARDGWWDCGGDGVIPSLRSADHSGWESAIAGANNIAEHRANVRQHDRSTAGKRGEDEADDGPRVGQNEWRIVARAGRPGAWAPEDHGDSGWWAGVGSPEAVRKEGSMAIISYYGYGDDNIPHFFSSK